MKYNIFPAFRGFGHDSVNLTETGHSSYKHDHQLSLVNAAYDNIISITMQIADYEEFMTGNVKLPEETKW